MTLQIQARLRHASGFELKVDCELPLQGVTALFGRSGCGKTTLLRIIAGLERVPDAQVCFGDQAWQQSRQFVPLHQRRIGLVFQEPSLLPHLSVRDNLLYGYKRTPAALRRLHLPEVTAMLDIEELLDRRINQLSGGQRQRISLGRALLISPQLLLLDEPMAALDTRTKSEIMPFLSRMAAQAEVPIIMVSHAPEEVERLADRIIFMHDGQIERIETLQEALSRPDSPLFADAGAASILVGSLGDAEEDGMRPFGPVGARLWVPGSGLNTDAHDVRLRVLAKDVSLSLVEPRQISIQNHLQVSIECIYPPHNFRTLVACRTTEGQLLLAEVTPRAVRQLDLAAGQKVYALIKSVGLLT
ncbi:molybdenum ABC transporter ATP-binding protein [Halopseudomonas salina]|uniref:Molybdenum import ATP-binding protein ModC n=1 Tax=Halopseudomonas salina TaxID=1323744 RepID=A0ABQ1PA06_9GAMM|nr:molybdenum ABC transporter ATP-binding protein [Halopseudomonas salina]GGC93922.1 molybdenum import ATP-binding protein ModC [Halopseudomonas salina]